jgi:cytochrome b6-f complex iron-sulfur subunit
MAEDRMLPGDDQLAGQPRDEAADASLQVRAERFERYLDALLAGGRPSPDDVEDRDEAEMARLAAEMSAVADPDAGDPDPAFLDQLRLRMRQADSGIASVQEPLPVRAGLGGQVAGASSSRIRVTRRQLLIAGLTGAAGLAAGTAGATVLGQAPGQERDWIWDDGTELVPGDFEWVTVAQADQLPVGSAVRFTTAAFDGYVVNDEGEIRALSAVCTHMGCTLQFRPLWGDLRCPCHGASFDLQGQLANGRVEWRANGGYRGDERAYPIDLPNLVRPEVRVLHDQVQVKTVRIKPSA